MKLRNPVLILLVISLIFIISIEGCIDNNKNISNTSNTSNTSNNPDGLYTYSLSLNTSDKNDFTLYVPIPILINGSLFRAIDNIQLLQGDVTISFIDTIYGRAMNITGHGNFLIQANFDGCTKVELSMGVGNASNEIIGFIEYWLFFNSTEVNDTYTIKLISESNNWVNNNDGEKIKLGSSFKTIIEGDLIQGWQKISAQSNVLIVD